jgi:Tol biopolymer transport system component
VVAALVAAGVGVWAVLPRNDPPADQGSASESGSPTGTSPSLPSTSAAPVPVPGLPSSAPLSGDTMVFSLEVDNNTDLYLVDVASNAIGQRLTSGATPDFAPLISPDRGSIIYFHNMGSAPNQLRVVAADGTGDRPLFADVPAECAGQDNYQPAWSPADPTVLAISCEDAGGNRSLRLVTVGGEVIRELDTPDTIVDDLTFSRDGGTLVFWSGPDRDAQGGSLWSVAAAGGQAPVRLTDQPPGTDADPAWSPDGQQIAFRRGGGANANIFLMNPDGSGERPLVTDTGPDSDPTWSPDGSRIAFVSGRSLGDGQDQHVWVVGADGSGQRPLLEGAPGELLYSQAWSRR